MTPNSQRAQYRKFALLIAGVLALAGALLLWRGKGGVLWCFAISLLMFALGVVIPEKLGFLYGLWMGLAERLGWLMTRLVLAVLYYGIVTPIGFFARLSGSTFLDVALRKEAQSYWIEKGQGKPDKRRYEMQH